MHPLAEDVTQLSEADLNKKYNDLSSRLMQSYRFGNGAMVNQIQMLLDVYKSEIANRQRKQMEEMMAKSDKFNNIIDIK
jgi:predicted transcriptional regulator of viral defense system